MNEHGYDELALADFEWYCDVLMGYRPYRCHAEWIEGLMSKRRLLITAPPEHAKTTYVGILYPSWRIARDPNIRVVIVCATEAAAEERARAIQSILTDERYQGAFPWIEPGEPWSTTAFTVRRERIEDPFPTVWACGVGSNSLIGRRADLIVLDDPMSEENARSELQRKLLDTWLRRTLITRLTDEPDSQFVCIMTRWHEADAAATLLDMGFHHIAQPASPDAPIWPERFGREYLERRRQEMGSALYNCMYLGDPSGLEGRLILREWLEPVSRLPAMRWCVAGVDLATTARTSADCTAVVKLGVGEDGRHYLLDVERYRAEWPEVRRNIMAFCAKHPDIETVGIEAVAFQAAAVQDLRAMMAGRVNVRGVKVASDKYSRALTWVPCLESGSMRVVALPREVIDELTIFPQGAHDDVVDAISVAFECSRSRSRLEVY